MNTFCHVPNCHHGQINRGCNLYIYRWIYISHRLGYDVVSDPWLCPNYVDIIDLIMDVHAYGMTHGSGYGMTKVLIDVHVCLDENGLCLRPFKC